MVHRLGAVLAWSSCPARSSPRQRWARPCFGTTGDGLLGRSDGLIRRRLALVDAGPGIAEALDRGLQGIGHSAAHFIEFLTRPLSHHHHIARVVVEAREPRGHGEAATLIFGESRRDQRTGLQSVTELLLDRGGENGVGWIAELLQRVVHLFPGENGEVAVYDLVHPAANAVTDGDACGAVLGRERMRIGDQHPGRVRSGCSRCGTASGDLGRKNRERQRGQQRQKQQTDQTHYMASAKEQKSEIRSGDPRGRLKRGQARGPPEQHAGRQRGVPHGRRGIRTPDILRVRQALWTS